MKKIISLLMCVIMLTAVLSFSVSAETGYVNTEEPLYLSTSADRGRSVLSGVNRKIYDILKEKIADVAVSGGSAVFTMPADVYETLKVKYDPDTQQASDVLGSLVKRSVDVHAVMLCLLADFPYEMYWFDKISGLGYSYGYTWDGISSAQVTSLTVKMSVIDVYRAPGYDKSNPAVRTDLSDASAAVTAAKKVVSDNKNKSDMDKLIAYKNYITGAVSYNYDALRSDSYGSPWQMIYVFDGRSDTNVVCEGYSKAFQYLCMQSDFAGDIKCYSVLGTTDGSGHMWNLVVMNGISYLVDLTNCDEGMIGQNGELFMVNSPQKGNAKGYTFKIGTQSITYAYIDESMMLFTDSIRTLKGTSATVAVTGVSLNKTSLSLRVGEKAALTATVAPSNASNKNVIWRSSDSSVATVDESGRISALKPGNTTVTVTTEDGSKKTTCSVSVLPVSVTGVSLNKTSLSLKVGEKATLTATVTPSNASNKKVSWGTSDASVATVDINGKITAVGEGSATVTVTSADGSKKAICTVTVTALQTGETTGAEITQPTETEKPADTTVTETEAPADTTTAGAEQTTAPSNTTEPSADTTDADTTAEQDEKTTDTAQTQTPTDDTDISEITTDNVTAAEKDGSFPWWIIVIVVAVAGVATAAVIVIKKKN